LRYQVSTVLDIEMQQELPSASIQKCERKKDQLCSEEWKKPKASMTSLNKAPFQKKSFYEIGPPSWIKKVINTSTLKYHLVSTTISSFIEIEFCVQQECELKSL
jgi:hypothetical protein